MDHHTITTDAPRHDAAGPDAPRQDATRNYSLTLDEVAARFEAAGLPRSMRTLQRWCASGRIDGLKTDTIDGERYFVDPHSVDRAITELQQLSALTRKATPSGDTGYDGERHDAMRRDTTAIIHGETPGETDRDEPRHDAARPDMSQPDVDQGHRTPHDAMRHSSPTSPAPSRHDAAESTFMTRYVERIEAENVFLREQVDRKDQQIASLLERDKETNFLVRGLQQMLSPLLGSGSSKSERNARDYDDMK